MKVRILKSDCPATIPVGSVQEAEAEAVGGYRVGNDRVYFFSSEVELIEVEPVPDTITAPASQTVVETPTTFTPPATGVIRTFATGATRDTEEGKLNYVKALSPIVLKRYVEYLGGHRTQSDGSLRDWNNWKQGIPQQTYFESLYRHFHAAWLLRDGFRAGDNHGPVTLEDSLCGILFNTMGYLHEHLKEKNASKTT